MTNIKTTILEKPLVLIPNGDTIPLVGVTKIDFNLITKVYTYYLGERQHKGFNGYAVLGTYENGEIIYK